MPNVSYSLADILKSSDYALDIFTEAEKNALAIFDKNGKPYLNDACSGKDRPAKPEEIVRQLFLSRLMQTYGYPASRISVEKGVYFGSSIAEKRADIFISDKNDPNTAYIIVEVKKPKRRDGLEQLKSYCNAEAHRLPYGQTAAKSLFCTAKTPTLTALSPIFPKPRRPLPK